MKEYEIQIEIEKSCLLNCVHCSSYEMRKFGKRSYSDEVIIDFLSCFQGPIHVCFTGGDPLLYPNLITLCQNISSCKANVSIGLYTSGNCAMMQPISEEFAVLLAHAGVKECYFSIYHSIPKVHDDFTGRKGSFHNMLLSARSMQSVGILPKAHLVLNKINQKDLDSIISYCGDIGFVEVRILRLTMSGNASANWDKIGIPIIRQNEIIASLITRREDFNVKLSFSGYPHLHACRSSRNAYKCQAGTNLLYITLSGDVYPCACTTRAGQRYKLGNINNPKEIINRMNALYADMFNHFCLNESDI